MDADCTTYAGEFHTPANSVPRYDKVKYPHTVYGSKSDVNLKTIGVYWRDKDFELWDDMITTSGVIPGLSTQSSDAAASTGAKIGKADKRIVVLKDRLTVGLRNCPLQTSFGITDFVVRQIQQLGILCSLKFCCR